MLLRRTRRPPGAARTAVGVVLACRSRSDARAPRRCCRLRRRSARSSEDPTRAPTRVYALQVAESAGAWVARTEVMERSGVVSMAEADVSLFHGSWRRACGHCCCETSERALNKYYWIQTKWSDGESFKIGPITHDESECFKVSRTLRTVT